MKRGDLVVPTWKRSGGRRYPLNSVEIGIVVETKPVNANEDTLIQVKVAVLCRAEWSHEKAFVPKWYHCSHWIKVNEIG